MGIIWKQVQSDHKRILPRSGGGIDSIRRDTTRNIRERGEMAKGAKRAHRSQHSDNAGGEQGRLAAPAGSVDGGRTGIRRERENILHGNLSLRVLQRREFLHRSPHTNLPRRQPENPRHRR